MEEITLKEAIGGNGVKINFTKLKERAKKCKEEKDSRQCRRELTEMGIDFVD